MQNSEVDASGSSIRTCSVSEVWYNAGNVAAGAFLGDVTMWVRQTNGSDGWAAYVSSLDADGFTITFSGGFTTGASGKRIYYLAGDEAFEQVASSLAFVPGSPAYSIGWRPQAFFGIGAGGGLGDSPRYTFALGDQSVPSVCFGDWGEYTVDEQRMNSQWRGILDPNVNVQEWWGRDIAATDITILEPTQSGGVWFSDSFAAVRTDTSFLGSVTEEIGFSNGEARMQPLILGSVDSIIGSFTPSLSVGVPTQVELPFVPEAVVFFSPQEHRAGVGNTSLKGATGWGFCTETDQALLIYGGFWNPPTAMNSNMLISSSKCWVGNCIEGDIGTIVNAGSAQINDAGFVYETTENDASVTYPVLYWAFAPAEEAPGFFRVLYR
jgi:hypothetical protein